MLCTLPTCTCNCYQANEVVIGRPLLLAVAGLYIFFWLSLSAISRSSHSTFMLCTALALLSASMYNITLDFVLILALVTGGMTHKNNN